MAELNRSGKSQGGSREPRCRPSASSRDREGQIPQPAGITKPPKTQEGFARRSRDREGEVEGRALETEPETVGARGRMGEGR